ncbi:MAG: hypothetical protein SFU25_02565 [Candidatus Caenarcaniphilales bacterium]|nr:hypothetical protein [Candidatus Caenarcaniphilales bacterium]
MVVGPSVGSVGANASLQNLDTNRVYIGTSKGSGSEHGHIFALYHQNGQWMENDRTGAKPIELNNVGVAVALKDQSKDQFIKQAAEAGGGTSGRCYENVAGQQADSILNKADKLGDINGDGQQGGDIAKSLDSARAGKGSAWNFEATALNEPQLLEQMGFEVVGKNESALHASTRSTVGVA